MNNYLLNLSLWRKGWSHFDQITFKPGWSSTSWKWIAIYCCDYLACCLILAGPVTSISNYWYEFWGVTGRHFAHAGPPLFGSVRCKPWVRVLVPLLWATLLALLILAVRNDQ